MATNNMRLDQGEFGNTERNTCMENTSRYLFRYRSEYDSANKLIEFVKVGDGRTFKRTLLDAIKEMNPEILGEKDVWANDEVLYSIHSNYGPFSLSMDSWGMAFILAEENQEGILLIYHLLRTDHRFEESVSIPKTWTG